RSFKLRGHFLSLARKEREVAILQQDGQDFLFVLFIRKAHAQKERKLFAGILDGNVSQVLVPVLIDPSRHPHLRGSQTLQSSIVSERFHGSVPREPTWVEHIGLCGEPIE